MGTVWRAYDETLQVRVAIKLIGFDPSDAGMRQRLLNEARASARVQHPAIVRVFDVGETAAGHAFIVMEALEGEDLSRRIGVRARLPAAQAVALLLPAVGAIAAAHTAGVIHRDIKPSNIFLTSPDGERIHPKLLDFGIATVRDGVDDVRLTHPGTVMGSPGYMAPEQASGALDVDERADVWALAVVLYEMVTGALPFVAPNSQAMLAAVVADSPTPMTRILPGERELWRIVRRGLEKNRARRWPSAKAFGGALARWAVERGVTVDSTGASLAAVWRRETRAQPTTVGLLVPPTQSVRARPPTRFDGTVAQPSPGGGQRWGAPSWLSVGALSLSLLLAAGVHRSSWGNGQAPSSPGIESSSAGAYLADVANGLPAVDPPGLPHQAAHPDVGCTCSVARVAAGPGSPSSSAQTILTAREPAGRTASDDRPLPASAPF